MTTHAHSLHSFLKDSQKRLSSKLSQNFLIDPNITKKFVSLAEVTSNDLILEIGPGSGAITRELLNAGAQVIAIEKDFVLARELSSLLNSPNLQIIREDILNIDLKDFVPKGKKIKIISNLPFKITSPVFGKFLPLNPLIESLTLIVQKDILSRLNAVPDTKAFSSLTLFIQFYAQLTHCFDIHSNCYFPKPNVLTSALHLKLKTPEFSQAEALFEMIRKAFNQRRKMITSSLDFPKELIQKALIKLNLSPQARPENLSLEKWIQFYCFLNEDLKADRPI